MGSKRGSRRVKNKAATPIWAKVMVGVGSVLLVATATTGGYAKYMLDSANGAMDSKDLLGNGDEGGNVEGPLNLLLVGSDKRDDWNSAQSDSIMIMHINEDLDAANIVSIPRDLDVELAGSDCGGQPCMGKINGAFAQGGESAEESVTALAETITNLSGVEFDGAAMINFGGFTDLVDLFGGIELCLPYEMEVKHSKNEDYEQGPNGGRIYPGGCNEYGKEDVLPIVRERYAYDPEYTPNWKEEYAEWGLGDYGRQSMQQHFMKQLLLKAKQEGYVSNPAKVSTLIQEIGGQLLLDIGGHKPTDYAMQMTGIDPTKMTTFQVPSEPDYVSDGSSGVVIQPGEQEEAADELWEAIKEDELDKWGKENPDWINSDDD